MGMGFLASGLEGPGRLMEPDDIFAAMEQRLLRAFDANRHDSNNEILIRVSAARLEDAWRGALANQK